MILIPPIYFDANEGFATITMMALILLYCMLPKRIPLPIALLMMIFNSYLGRAVDNILSTDYPYNVYEIMDTPHYDLFDFLLYSIPFPLVGYFYVYFYDKYPLRAPNQFIHILVWAIASVGFEALAVTFSIFQYNGWELSYSFPVYLLTFALNTILYSLAKKHYKNWQPQ
ncbi:hypothetical protein [Paenibacillus sp. V4I7]|uniref:hypothetical protein n=1 Tax=Paenibacillus sp. V4I7 TaxID=3042307 RepID=UPI002780C2AB|nr:hypothetical protein [Paenibacillus sp. V4I7]MDQ0898379.1 hypothetical protein [Paenibacillus sp. V4I7]